MNGKILLCLLASFLFCAEIEAQVFNKNKKSGSSIAVGLLYDWQTDKGGIGDFRIASNIGVRFEAQGVFNDIWGFRLHATVPGLLRGETTKEGPTYDRRGMAAADLVVKINNLFDWKSVGDIYAAIGAGLVIGAGEGDASLGAEGGIGYTYWFTKELGVYSELDVTYYTAAKECSVTLALGLRISL